MTRLEGMGDQGGMSWLLLPDFSGVYRYSLSVGTERATASLELGFLQATKEGKKNGTFFGCLSKLRVSFFSFTRFVDCDWLICGSDPVKHPAEFLD